jgi:hypothetical protein
MALSKNYSFKTKYGIDAIVDSCYIKVNSTHTTKSFGTALVQFFPNDKSSVLEELPYQFVYDINGENPIKQAYLYLKTLPEFATATDC